MSESSLAAYVRLSPNRTVPREKPIDTVAIHCVVGQLGVQALGAVFADPAKQASSTYGIGPDGAIGRYCSEPDRPWTTSSRAVDSRAVTIECASDSTYPYAVTDACYRSLLDLLTDICRRNGIDKLVWSTDKNRRVNRMGGCNMMVHRDYENKSCPGDYLYSRHGAIAAEVNRRLAGEQAAPAEEEGKENYEMTVRTLREGSQGNDVFALQAYLHYKGCYVGSPDGIYGPYTVKGVTRFQKEVFPHEPAEWDGIAGPKTLAKVWAQ